MRRTGILGAALVLQMMVGCKENPSASNAGIARTFGSNRAMRHAEFTRNYHVMQAGRSHVCFSRELGFNLCNNYKPLDYDKTNSLKLGFVTGFQKALGQ